MPKKNTFLKTMHKQESLIRSPLSLACLKLLPLSFKGAVFVAVHVPAA